MELVLTLCFVIELTDLFQGSDSPIYFGQPVTQAFASCIYYCECLLLHL